MPATTELSLEQFAAALQAAGQSVLRLDFTRPLKVCAQLVKSDALENFQGSHDPDGNPWLPLKYARQGKRHKNSTPRPLLDRGILRASVTAAGTGHVETITPTSLVVGTNLDYAAIHQQGGTVHRSARQRKKPWVFSVGRKKVFTRKIRAYSFSIPARPYLGAGKALLGKIDTVLGTFVEEQVARLF